MSFTDACLLYYNYFKDKTNIYLSFSDWIKQEKIIIEPEGIVKTIYDMTKGASGTTHDSMLEYTREVIDENGNYATEWMDDVLDWFNQIFDSIASGYNSVKNYVEKFWEDTKKSFSNIVDGISDMIDSVGNWIKNVYNSVKDWLEDIIRNISKWIETIYNNIADFMDTLVTEIINQLKTAYNFVADSIEAIAESVVDGLSTIGEYIVDGIKEVITFVEDSFVDVYNAFLEVVDLFITEFNAGLDAIGAEITNVIELNTEAYKEGVEVGIEMQAFIWDEFKQMVEKLFDMSEGAMTKVMSTLFRVMKNVGANIIQEKENF